MKDQTIPRRIQELLEANNLYLDRARKAEQRIKPLLAENTALRIAYEEADREIALLRAALRKSRKPFPGFLRPFIGGW